MHYPTHIAVIPDGNRTRAKKHNKNSLEGHLAGVHKTVELTQHIFSTTPIKIFTGRGMSTENFHQRSAEEVGYLLELYKIAGSLLDNFLKKERINFHRIGSPKGLTPSFLDYLSEKEKNLTFDTDRHVNFCINYGGRDEIVRGVNKLIEQQKHPITEKDISDNLDFGGQPCVDLVIRTKGNKAQRTSGFMSWRIGYAELYFSDQLYPDFSIDHIQQALQRYNSIVDHKNFGA